MIGFLSLMVTTFDRTFVLGFYFLRFLNLCQIQMKIIFFFKIKVKKVN